MDWIHNLKNWYLETKENIEDWYAKKRQRFQIEPEHRPYVAKFLNIIILIFTGIIIYRFSIDVLYRCQIQFGWISSEYYWINSRDWCYALSVGVFICFWVKKWPFSFCYILFLRYVKSGQEWLFWRDCYTQAMHNGMVWHREWFNHDLNIYIYKNITMVEKLFVLNYELKQRLSGISLLIYRHCIPWQKDSWVQHFFDDFKLDWSDSDSFERIRAQIMIFQKNKIEWSRTDILCQNYEYLDEHPIKFYADDLWHYWKLGFSDYIAETIIFFGISIIVGAVLYYNLRENPFWHRWYPPEVEVEEEVVQQVGNTLADVMIKLTGNTTYNVEPIVFVNNLRELLLKNLELMSKLPEITKLPPPEVTHEIMSQLLNDRVIKEIIATHKICIKIAENVVTKMNSPFEQFEVLVLQRISFFGQDLSFSNLTLYLILAIVVIITLSIVIEKSISFLPNYWQSVIEIFYTFIFSMLIDQSGKRAKIFFPAIFSLFFFILVSNLLGLIPLSFAVTSHVVITFCLGFGFFVAWIIVAFKTIGLKIFNIFWPTNVPLWLRPLLMVVEILSFCLRPLSLSIRLFVNILAGHILLHLVAGSVVLVMSKAWIFSIIPFGLLLAVFFLELGIAFLQAYIFSILLCIYLHDSYHVH